METTAPLKNRLARRLPLFLAALIFIPLIASHPVCGQSESGNAAIEGAVLDGNGAAISGASISVRNVDTGLTRAGTTAANGRFSVPVLPVGHYSVKVEASGFGPAQRDEVTLRVGETTTVDFTLQPASVTEKLTITPDPEALDSEEGATSSTIAQRAIQDLPARGRNFSEYVLLTPGVMQESDRQGLVIAGQRSINSNVAIDGADFNDSLAGESARRQ